MDAAEHKINIADVQNKILQAVFQAYGHGQLTWTQLEIVFSLVDPALDAALSSQYDNDQRNFMLFKAVFFLAEGKAKIPNANYNEIDEVQQKARFTITSLFQNEDFTAVLCSVKALNIVLNSLTQAIVDHESDELYGEIDYAAEAKRAICDRAVVKLKSSAKET